MPQKAQCLLVISVLQPPVYAVLQGSGRALRGHLYSNIGPNLDYVFRITLAFKGRFQGYQVNVSVATKKIGIWWIAIRVPLQDARPSDDDAMIQRWTTYNLFTCFDRFRGDHLEYVLFVEEFGLNEAMLVSGTSGALIAYVLGLPSGIQHVRHRDHCHIGRIFHIFVVVI